MSRILVIDDEKAVLDSIVEILIVEGFDVVSTASGYTGLRLAEERLPDLILCDIMLPGLDGYGVLAGLRGNPATVAIPVIFLTARADRAAVRFGMGLGVDDYITKPFSVTELLTAITARLERSMALTRGFEQKLEDLRDAVTYVLPQELRAPLLTILGSTEQLLAQEGFARSNSDLQAVQMVYRSGQQLLRLMENFLVYAQLDLLDRTPMQMDGLRAARTAQPHAVMAAVAAGVAAQYARPDDLVLELAEVDSMQVKEQNLHKIIEELLGNAFQFSQAGTLVLLTSVCCEDSYRVSICDHGCGMSAEQVAAVSIDVAFERRLRDQHSRGLGLSIARRLVELHGGRLFIESVQHQQTVVHVSLPLTLDAAWRGVLCQAPV